MRVPLGGRVHRPPTPTTFDLTGYKRSRTVPSKDAVRSLIVEYVMGDVYSGDGQWSGMVIPVRHDFRKHRLFIPEITCVLVVLALALPTVCACAQEGDDTPSDRSLLFPTEVFVITADEVVRHNIHTLEDILEMLPGVYHWIAGPRGSRSGFSIDGRGYRGVTLLINGKPFYDPYTFEALARFVPVSRLERIEVVYSGSPLCTGDVSSTGAINFVIREGGEKGPRSEAEFTYGRNNRRARRVWFSTPQARIGATLAYDEYLQNAFESYIPIPKRRIGDYDARSVLMDIWMNTDAGDEVLVRLHRYEDTFVGTEYSPGEDVRFNGFDTEMRYRKNGFYVTLEQRGLSLSRRSVRRSDLLTAASAGWGGMIGELSTRTFLSARRTICTHTEGSIAFEPSFHRIEGGIGAGGTMQGALGWRLGIFGGTHSVAGSYLGGEAGIRRGNGSTLSFSLMASRRLRIPSAQELFQPEIAGDTTQVIQTLSTAGNEALSAEITEELALGTSAAGLFSLDVFARREKSRIVLTGTEPAVYNNTEGTGNVLGVRGSLFRHATAYGFRYSVSANAEFFGERNKRTGGIPEYRCRGGFGLERTVFKETETVGIRWDVEAVGKRAWDATTLGSYVVSNIAASMTILNATITVQMNNLFDTSYGTYPGFRMPERHYVIGVFWKFFD